MFVGESTLSTSLLKQVYWLQNILSLRWQKYNIFLW